MNWTTLLSTIVHENCWFSVVRCEVAQPNGLTSDFFAVKHRMPSVGIVARKDDCFLMIRQYRFIIDQYVWAIPSGGVEIDETPAQAARREFLEETGYSAGELRPLGHFFPSYGFSNQRFDLFFTCDVEATDKGFDTNEVVEVRWVSRLSLHRMLRNNEIVDGLSLVPLYQVLMHE